MSGGAKLNEESVFGVNDLKRFFQWILGCTYTKKTVRTRIAEMFHFAEAPHIVVYEKTEENPWWWTVGVILIVLGGVLSLWYTFESAGRSVSKFFRAVIHEPQSTVSTPLRLSPVKDGKDGKEVKDNKKSAPWQAAATPSDVVRKKVKMNEPVNCVFVRPVTPRSDSPPPQIPMRNLEDREDEEEMVPVPKKVEKKKISPPPRLEDVVFDGSSNVNCRPTMAASPFTSLTRSPATPNRKSSGKDKPATEQVKSSVSENGAVMEWIAEQIAGVQRLEAERSKAGADATALLEPLRLNDEEYEDHLDHHAVSGGFMDQIHELIVNHLNQDQLTDTDISSDENISEMSPVTASTLLSLTEFPFSSGPESDENSEKSPLGKPAMGGEEEADIVIDDCHVLAESENECEGSVQVSGGQQKVLFRWTDKHPDTVDTVTITGTFFGWKMNVPMRRSADRVFEICLDLPEGVHDYLINVFRFDS